MAPRALPKTTGASGCRIDPASASGWYTPPAPGTRGRADAHYLLLAPHNVCGPVGTAANVHFAVATPNYKVLEHFNDFADPWVRDLVDHPPRVDPSDGCFPLPERAGLGVRLDHAACAAHPRTGGRLKLFEAGWERRGV